MKFYPVDVSDMVKVAMEFGIPTEFPEWKICNVFLRDLPDFEIERKKRVYDRRYE